MRRQREAAKNEVEAYVYGTREKFYDAEEDVNAVTTEEQRDEINAALMDTEDWLYDEGEDASTKQYKAKLRELQALAEPVFERVDAMRELPALKETSLEVLASTRELIAAWETDKPQVGCVAV